MYFKHGCIESKDEMIYLYEFNQSISDGYCRHSVWSISWFIIWKPTDDKTSSKSLLIYINLSLTMVCHTKNKKSILS